MEISNIKMYQPKHLSNIKMYQPKHLARKKAPLVKMAEHVNVEILYSIGFTFIFFREYQRLQTYITLPEILDKLIYILGVVLLLIYSAHKVAFQTNKTKINLTILLLVGFESYLFSGESAPFTLMLILIATAEKDDIKQSLKIWLINATALFLITVSMFLIQAALNINGGVKVFYRSYFDKTPRYSLGYTHPNACASVLVMIYSVYLMLYGDKNNKLSVVKSIFLFFIVGIIALFITNSRTEIIVLVIVTIGWLTGDYIKRIQKLIKLITAGIPILFAVIVWLLSGPLFSYAIEGLFTNRVRLWHSFYAAHGISVLGQHFTETSYTSSNGWKYYNATLDSTYAYLLFVCGLLFATIMVVIWIRTIASKSTTSEITALLLAVSVFAFIETTAVWITVCGPILILSRGIKIQNTRMRQLS